MATQRQDDEQPTDAQPDRRTPAAGSRPRSLSEALRALTDEQLLELFRHRPDLAVPPVVDFGMLAARATGRASVGRALNLLDAAAVQVVEVLAVAPEPVSLPEVSRLWGAPAAEPVARLRSLALVWGPAGALRLVRGARESAGPFPAGLGPPLAEALGRRSPSRLADLVEDLGLPPADDPDSAVPLLCGHLARHDVLSELLSTAPQGTSQVLDRLTWAGPVGQVSQADRVVRAGTAATAVEWLLARGLLAVVDADHVVLPREVGIALRGGVVHARAETVPPPLVTAARKPEHVDGAAAAAASGAIRLVEALGELWGAAPPPRLRSGGLGVRELRRTATALEVSEQVGALMIEVAYAAGLVADDREADPHFAPTPSYDAWCAAPLGTRWAWLASAWLGTTRVPALVGTRDERGAVRAAMGPDVDRAAAPHLRRQVLDAVAQACREGPHAVDVESLRARLDWLSPRTASAFRDAFVGWVLDEAATLGLTAAGALARPGLALLAPPEGDASGFEAAADALDAALPEPVDHVLIQADLTAVAPGPLEPALARELTLIADVESRGGATVYRFTPGSVRRALDAGRTGEEILTLLAARSRTPVPQVLSYLVQDTARRHGHIRIGSAQAYVRAEEPAILSEVLADRRAGTLRLRRLAPTVLAAQAAPHEVLEVLRAIGLAPVAETVDGDVVVGRPQAHRTPACQPPTPVGTGRAPEEGQLLATVRALRASVNRPEPAPVAPAGPALQPTDPVNALAALRQAATERQAVWIGYVDGDGRTSRRLVEPLSVESGRVTVMDCATSDIKVLSVHRVSAVGQPLDG